MPFIVLVYLVLAVVVIIAGVAMALLARAPKSATDTNKLENSPIAEGANIPVLFGTRLIKAPSIAWWAAGNIINVEIPSGGKKG